MLLVLNYATVKAQEIKLTFNHYTQADGLSDNWVLSFLQDDRGFLWIGTWNGLNRFDGKDFKSYYYEPGNPGTPAGNEIKCLVQDSSGMIWIGTENGLCRLDPLAEVFTTLRFDSSLSEWIEFSAIHALAPDGAGGIYAGGNGLFKLSGLDGTLLPAPGDLNSRLFDGTGHSVNHILDDGPALWLGTSRGIIRYDKSSSAWQQVKYSADQADLPGLDFINSIYQDRSGVIWAGSWGAGLLKVDKEQLSITGYFLPQPDFADAAHNILNGITETNNTGEEHLLWITGVAGGLFSFDKITGTFRNFGSGDPDEKGKVYQIGYPVFHHPETGLWIGTKLGFYQYDVRQQNIIEFEPAIRALPVPASSVYYSMVVADPADSAGNTVWLATNNQGLYRCNMRSGEIHQWNKFFGQLLEPDIFISSIHRDQQNRIWVSTLLNGLIGHDPSGLKNQQFIFRNFSGNEIRWIHEVVESAEDDNLLWVASNGGLFLFEKSTGRYRQLSITGGGQDWSDVSITRIEVEKPGRLWILGYSEALKSEFIAILESPDEQAHLILGPLYAQESNYLRMTDFALSDSGTVFIGAHKGLFRLNFPDSGATAISPVFHNNRQITSRVDQLVNDRKGKIWAQVAGDLYLYDPVAGDLLTLTFSGLQKNAGFNLNRNEITGDMIAGAWNRIFIIRNDSNLLSRQPLRKYITGISTSGGYFRSNREDRENLQIVLPYDQNDVTVEFSALNYKHGSFHQYAYRMKGLDENWTFTGNESVSFKLAPGNYRFELRASNAYGFWDESAIYAEINIRPPYYMTWWFVLLAIVFITALTLGLYRYRISQLLKLQKMRDRISRDLHDEIGSSLTNIAIMNELALQETRRQGDPETILRKSAEDIHEVISSLSDIVWNVNPVYDDLNYLLARMRWYAAELLDNTDIQYYPDIPEPDGKIMMNMEQRRDFYLVFKEGLNNLVKYSKASKAEIAIRIDNDAVYMRIGDDGIGFEPAQIEFGNGLKNMRQRTEGWKGKFTITSARGQGTVLDFFIPLTN